MKQIIILICMSVCFADDLVKSLHITSGINSQIEEAIKRVPKNQYDGMKWLIENMPREDLNKISSEFLLSTCQLAYDTRGNTPWGKKIPDELFFTYVLPYANLNEQIKKDGDVLKEVKLSTTYNEITLKSLIEKTKMEIGGLKFFNGYSARRNNCQHFIMAMLDGLGLNTKELSELT